MAERNSAAQHFASDEGRDDGFKILACNKKSQYRKPKKVPVNYESIDKWRMPEISAELVKGPFLEESSFATLFPKYREKYIREVWSAVQKGLSDIGVKGELDLIEGSMTVRTTKKTYDPYAIIKGRDIIKLLARSVPYQVALRLLDDDTYCDIIKIKSLIDNKEKFVKRRQRLIGPGGETLKALEILTECYIMVQGSTVSVVGHYKRLKQVRRIVEDVMHNIHPLYFIKELMIKKELQRDEKLRDENWERFLPSFKKANDSRKKIKKAKKQDKRERAAFLNAPQPRKEDLQMESGEYFLSEKDRAKAKFEQKVDKQKERALEKRGEKEELYREPDVADEVARDRRKRQTKAISRQKTNQGVDVSKLVERFQVDQKPSLF